MIQVNMEYSTAIGIQECRTPPIGELEAPPIENRVRNWESIAAFQFFEWITPP